MCPASLVSRIKAWSRDQGGYRFERSRNRNEASIMLRTTGTRASSVASRIDLVAREVASGTPYDVSVSRELVGPPPKSKDDLADWRIEILVSRRVASA